MHPWEGGWKEGRRKTHDAEESVREPDARRLSTAVDFAFLARECAKGKGGISGDENGMRGDPWKDMRTTSL